MIARILYRPNVHSVLNYVLGKESIKILGYGNTPGSGEGSNKFFASLLHYQGQRNPSPKRFAHITLNLPHSDYLNDSTFYRAAQAYMEHMGYGQQPYIVVRHHDTLHHHVHIVSTTVRDDGSMLSLYNDFRRNRATQHYLEKAFGLSPSPKTKSTRKLPEYRLPKMQFSTDWKQGTKFYIQDVINGILQKYKVRSFRELEFLAKPYHIVLRTRANGNGRMGIAFGIDYQKRYRTQFIPGSMVHPQLSAPQLQSLFRKNARSKLLPIHRKRLEKQLTTTYGLFELITQEDLPDILKSHQDLDVELVYDNEHELLEGVIHDKSKYLFKVTEINRKLDFKKHAKLHVTGKSQIDVNGKQFGLEIKKLIKATLEKAYLESNKGKGLLSEYLARQTFAKMLPKIIGEETFSFLNGYLDGEDRKLVTVIEKTYLSTCQGLAEKEFKVEKQVLQDRIDLFRRALQNGLFDFAEDASGASNLLQNLGLQYENQQVCFSNSSSHRMPLDFLEFTLEPTLAARPSTGFTNQLEKVLQSLIHTEKDIRLSATAFFLPLVMPNLFESMTNEYLLKCENMGLEVYIKYAQHQHGPFEKSPSDYIRFFNAKGFYLENFGNVLFMKSVYTDSSSKVRLDNRVQAYLKSDNELPELLAGQNKCMQPFFEQGKTGLKQLWLAYLIERGQYGRAAFLMVCDQVSPRLPKEILENHKGNGLRDSLIELSNKKFDTARTAALRRAVYAISSLIGRGKQRQQEAFNGFKDEFALYRRKKTTISVKGFAVWER